jgi:hypothetical protein
VLDRDQLGVYLSPYKSIAGVLLRPETRARPPPHNIDEIRGEIDLVMGGRPCPLPPPWIPAYVANWAPGDSYGASPANMDHAQAPWGDAGLSGGTNSSLGRESRRWATGQRRQQRSVCYQL